VFPALILGQIVSAIDAGIFFEELWSAEERQEAIAKAIARGVHRAKAAPTLDFTIYHICRVSDWPSTTFRAWNIEFNARHRGCRSSEAEVPSTTEIIGLLGSGRIAAKVHRDRWEEGDSAGRSRAIFSAFCDAISSNDDPFSGGAPQLAALYTKGSPVQIGTYIDGRRYLNGLEVPAISSLKSCEWRDRLNQRIDPISGLPADGARRFARPSSPR
jgi:hypothetical protein